MLSQAEAKAFLRKFVTTSKFKSITFSHQSCPLAPRAAGRLVTTLSSSVYNRRTRVTNNSVADDKRNKGLKPLSSVQREHFYVNAVSLDTTMNDEPIDDNATRGSKLDTSMIVSSIREEVGSFTSRLQKAGKDPPRLITITTHDTETPKHPLPPSLLRATRLAEHCWNDGLNHELWSVDSPTMLVPMAEEAARDPSVTGVSVVYPAFDQRAPELLSHAAILSHEGKEDRCPIWGCYKWMDDEVRDVIARNGCDVEGLRGKSNIWVGALERVLDKVELKGSVVTIFRNEVTGRDFIMDSVIWFLVSNGANVYSVSVGEEGCADAPIFRYGSDGIATQCDEVINVEGCVKRSSYVIDGRQEEDMDGEIKTNTADIGVKLDWIQSGSTVINLSLMGGDLPALSLPEDEVLSKIPYVNYISDVDKIALALTEHNLVQLYKASCQENDNKSEEIVERRDMKLNASLKNKLKMAVVSTMLMLY